MTAGKTVTPAPAEIVLMNGRRMRGIAGLCARAKKVPGKDPAGGARIVSRATSAFFFPPRSKLLNAPSSSALALHGFQRHASLEARVMVSAFRQDLISSFVETSTRQMVASTPFPLSGRRLFLLPKPHVAPNALTMDTAVRAS